MISYRIQKIASLIENDESVLDIGCDHGYVALLLRKNGNNQNLICADNKKGPLNSAKSNLASFDNIDFVLSDGASNVEKQVNTITIAGMGYHTVIGIIVQSLAYFRKANKIIIQVNLDVDKMRKWLIENDFTINKEVILFEGKHYYEILVCQNGKQEMNDLEIKYGKYHLELKDEEFKKYLLFQKEKNKKILTKINSSSQDYEYFKKQIAEIDLLLTNLFNVFEI